MDGLFLENGPFKVNGDLSVSVNPHAWTAVANVLYIDQPVGTGLSYTKGGYPKNDGDVNRNLLEFFDDFFTVHDDLAGREMFLSGESHAGHYLPSFAQAIVKRSDKQGPNHPNKNEVINLAGVCIGNGWFDPRNQYDVSEFAHGVGLVSHSQAISLKQKEKMCRGKLDSGSYMNGICWDLLDDVVKQSGAPGKSKVLMYDIRKYAKVWGSTSLSHSLAYPRIKLTYCEHVSSLHALTVKQQFSSWA
jgi:carboxypeptidase D